MTDVTEQTETTDQPMKFDDGTVVEATPVEVATEEKPKKEKKVVELKLRPCRCASFEVGEETETDGQPDRTIFTTGCDKTTQRVFAQGHDARLVSFLVSAEMDGYTVWQNTGGTLTAFPGSVEAAASVSEALGEKAKKALANGKARIEGKEARAAEKAQAKAERDATKAKAKADREAAKEAAAAAKPKPAEKKLAEAATVVPREVPVKVVSGSESGDVIDGSGGPTELEEGEKAVTIKVGRNEILATLSADGQTVSWRNGAGEYKERSADTVRILADA